MRSSFSETYVPEIVNAQSVILLSYQNIVVISNYFFVSRILFHGINNANYDTLV